MLKQSILRTMDKKRVPYDKFVSELQRLDKKGLEVYIGTDSQIIKDKISIVTCVCFYKRGISENQIYYMKKIIDKDKCPTLRSRIYLEAYESLEAALEVDPMIRSTLTVHLDIGGDFKKNKTAKFRAELENIFKSQGFGCEIKPDSWASSSIADGFTKR
jgi:uncharacterized protein